jgi:hypothetical protein
MQGPQSDPAGTPADFILSDPRRVPVGDDVVHFQGFTLVFSIRSFQGWPPGSHVINPSGLQRKLPLPDPFGRPKDPAKGSDSKARGETPGKRIPDHIQP